MDLIENSTVFLYPVVRAMFDHIYGGVFFGPKLFVYPIVDAILRNLYVNEVPESYIDVVRDIGGEAVDYIQNSIKDYGIVDGDDIGDEKHKSFILDMTERAATFIYERAVKVVDDQLHREKIQNKTQKRRRNDADVQHPENPRPPGDLVPSPRHVSQKKARLEEDAEGDSPFLEEDVDKDTEEDSPVLEENVDEDAEEDSSRSEKDVVTVLGPSNSASIPFQELSKHLNSDVSKLVYSYFSDVEDLFFLSDEDIERM